MRKILATAAAAAVVLGVVTGCASLGSAPWRDTAGALQRTSDVGEVRVKAFPALRFEDIRAKLVPGLTLSAEDAVLQAIATTMLDDSSASKSTRFALEVAGPQRTSERIRKWDGGALTADTEELKTTSSEAKDIGSAPEPLPMEALRSLDGRSVADARLVQFTAAGLRQDVAWLNNYIQNISIPKGYKASLVTLHVAVQPFQANLPVNAIVDISIWPGDMERLPKKHPLPLVMVQPVMMTDNLEANSRNLKSHRQRDISLGANVSVDVVNAKVGAGNSAAEQRQRLGQDLNGVSTVGFADNNRIKMQLGAQSSVSGGEEARGLVSRSHIVSALVLTHENISSLTINSETYYVDLRNNQKICDPGPSGNEPCKRMPQQEAENFQVTLQSCEALADRKLGRGDDADKDLWRDFRGLVRDGQLAQAIDCMRERSSMTRRERSRFFSSITGDAVYGQINTFELPLPEALPGTSMPPKQLVLLAAEKDTITAFLAGGGSIDPRSLEAFLYFKDGRRIPALSVAAAAEGRGLTVQFARRAAPALASIATSAPKTALKTAPRNTLQSDRDHAGGSVPAYLQIDVFQAKEHARSQVRGESLHRYHVEYLPKAEEAKEDSPANPFKLDSDVVLVDSRGRAELHVRLPQVFFEKRDGKKAPLFTLSGAQVASVQGVGVSNSGDGVIMTKAGVAVLALRNVVPLKPLMLRAIVDTKVASSPLVITAVRATR